MHGIGGVVTAARSTRIRLQTGNPFTGQAKSQFTSPDWRAATYERAGIRRLPCVRSRTRGPVRFRPVASGLAGNTSLPLARSRVFMEVRYRLTFDPSIASFTPAASPLRSPRPRRGDTIRRRRPVPCR